MIKKILFFFFFISFSVAGECYSILTQTGVFTPVYPYNFKTYTSFVEPQCNLLNQRIIFDTNLSYVGCYKTYKEANYTLHHLKFNFLDPKIIKHKVRFKDQYVIFPNGTYVKARNIDRVIQKYKPSKIIAKYPKHFYGEGIDFVNIEKIVFMPAVNLYEFYKFYKKHNLSRKVMILYNGVYSIDYLYKKINNPKIIQKVSKNTYILKMPLYISPTATLVINNKKLLLETVPKPIFIMYHGKIYAKNSKFIAWDVEHYRYAKREKIPESKILMIGIQKPRPYFIGLKGSKSYFVNNLFKGLGFHSTSATFGIALLSFPTYGNINNFNLFLYLSKRNKPEGIYVGNTMTKNMMGFYCSRAKNSVLIGNLMYDNKIYNIDPHDYSDNLWIVRNITSKAGHAHGIVVSRQVDYSVIAQNMTFNNHSAGIMLDRLSNHNFIYDNFSFLNGYMGMSVQESDDELIYKNKFVGNGIDGIIVRNSLRNSIIDNEILYNRKNGVEILTKNIDGTVYRNFARDPYHKATAAVVRDNKIYNNILYGITVKNNAAIYLKNNSIKSENYSKYGGNLNMFVPEIAKNGGKFTLYGIGNPFRRISSDLIKMYKSVGIAAIDIFVDVSCKNSSVSDQIAKLYEFVLNQTQNTQKEYIRGVSLLMPKDMASYGFYLLVKSKNQKEIVNALSYVAQSIIFGNSREKYDLLQTVYMLPISKNDINKAFEIALNRLKNGKVIDDPFCVTCKMDIQKKAKIESVLKTFEYKYRLSGADNYFEYCKKTAKKFTLFTPDIVKKIKYLFYKANTPKSLYARKILKENQFIDQNTKCKQVAIRLKKINSSLTSYYEENKKFIFKRVMKDMDKYLKMVNQYRIEKVTKRQILELMQEKK